MKLKSGGAIPKAPQMQARSDTLLPSRALAEAAGAGEGNTGASPCGTFIFAAGGRKVMIIRRRIQRRNLPGI